MEKYEQNLKYAFFSLLPLLVYFLISGVAYFAAFFITASIESIKTEAAGDDVVNPGIFNLVCHLLGIWIFGYWYYHKLKEEKQGSFRSTLLFFLHPLHFLALVASGFCLQIFTDSVLAFLDPYFPEAFRIYNTQFATATDTNTVSALFIFTVVVTGPVMEELLFRGVTMTLASRGLSFPVALLLQAFLFALYHGNLIQDVYAFFFGLLFGIIVRKTGSILPSILLHISVNLAAYTIPAGFFDKIIVRAAALILSMAVTIPALWFVIRSGRKNHAAHKTS